MYIFGTRRRNFIIQNNLSVGAAGGKTGLEDSDDDDDDADDDADNDSVNSADSRSDEDGAPGDEERGVQEAVEKDGGGEDSASDVSASNLASSKLKKIKKKSMKSKKEKKEKKKRRHSEDSKPKKKRKKSRFIQDLVEVGSDESDDEIEAEVEEEELSADALRAQALVDERNRNRNKFLDADANEVARRFEEQAAQDRILKERLFSGSVFSLILFQAPSRVFLNDCMNSFFWQVEGAYSEKWMSVSSHCYQQSKMRRYILWHVKQGRRKPSCARFY